MKLRMTIGSGLSLAVAIYAGYLFSLFHPAGLRVAAVQYPVLAEWQRPSPMTINDAGTPPGIMTDPNFRVVLRALEQRGRTQPLREPEEVAQHGVMTLGPSLKVNRALLLEIPITHSGRDKKT